MINLQKKYANFAYRFPAVETNFLPRVMSKNI